MASGAADRLDVTTWIPSARNAQAPRSGWEAAGVAARAGNSAQDRFGAALSAAQAARAAAGGRAADQRDVTDAARARQADCAIRPTPRGARTARDAALRSEARAADKKASLAKPADAAAPAEAAAPADAAAPAARARQAEGQPSVAGARTAETGRTETAGRQGSEAAAAGEVPASEMAATADHEAASIDAAALPQKAETAAQPAGSSPSASLLALIAALSEGGAATGTVKVEADGDTGTAPAQDGAAALPGTGVAAGPPGTDARGSGRAGGAVSGVAGSGPATASAGGHEPGKVGPGSVPVDGPTAGAGGAAAATSDAATQDFLTVLTDAGQGAGPLQTMPAAAQGGPTPPIPTGQAVDTSRAAQEAAAPNQSAASVRTDPPIPIGQVPMTIGLRSLRGSNEFQIRLDPAELGRIDVKLEIDKAHGRVMTHLVVDRPETLALLQRDSGQLQQALSQAGFDPAAGGINLSLRGDGSAQSGGSGGQPGDSPRGGGTGWSRDQADAPQEIAPIRHLRGYGGVDMRI